MRKFYYILDKSEDDGWANINLNIGIFDETSIEEIKNQLFFKKKACAKESLNVCNYNIDHNEKEKESLTKVINICKSVKEDYAEDFIENRLCELNKSIISGKHLAEYYSSIAESDDIDYVLKESGYKIVEVPVCSHCNDKTLKEFIYS